MEQLTSQTIDTETTSALCLEDFSSVFVWFSLCFIYYIQLFHYNNNIFNSWNWNESRGSFNGALKPTATCRKVFQTTTLRLLHRIICISCISRVGQCMQRWKKELLKSLKWRVYNSRHRRVKREAKSFTSKQTSRLISSLQTLTPPHTHMSSRGSQVLLLPLETRAGAACTITISRGKNTEKRPRYRKETWTQPAPYSDPRLLKLQKNIP